MVRGKNVRVEEMMVMTYGRSPETVKMRNKPIGSCLKLWALCYFVYKFFSLPHSNSFGDIVLVTKEFSHIHLESLLDSLANFLEKHKGNQVYLCTQSTRITGSHLSNSSLYRDKVKWVQ